MYVTHCPMVIHSCAKYGMAVSKADFSVNQSSKTYFGTSDINHFNTCRTVAIWTKNKWYGKLVLQRKQFSLHRYFPFFILYDFLVFCKGKF